MRVRLFLGALALGLLFGGNVSAGNVVALGAQEALQASEAAKAFREKLIEETAGAEKRVQELELQARELQKKAQAQGVSTEEAQRVQLQFQKVYQEFQQQAQALQQNRAEREAAFIAEMRPKLDQVIRQLIDEQDISVILNRQATIYMEAGVDITPEVVKRLNAL